MPTRLVGTGPRAAARGPGSFRGDAPPQSLHNYEKREKGPARWHNTIITRLAFTIYARKRARVVQRWFQANLLHESLQRKQKDARAAIDAVPRAGDGAINIKASRCAATQR